jgi:hypothetical protein
MDESEKYPMMDKNSPNLQRFTDIVLKSIFPEINRSFNSEQAAWAVQVFKHIILPDYHRSGESENEVNLQFIAQLVAEDIREDWVGLSAAEKWDWIWHKSYACQLLPISQRIFELAKARFLHIQPQNELLHQAASVQQQLADIVLKMEKHAPRIRRNLNDIISETELDCQYVLGKGQFISLRMNNFIQRKGKQNS